MALKKSVTDEVSKISETIDQEEQRHIDLETPAVDEDGIVRNAPLLAGYIDKEGILHDTFSYREMTGKDEEAISKNDVRANPAKLANILAERCVVAIGSLTKKECGLKWGEIIRSMLGSDIDYMDFRIRELSKGAEVEFTHKCPNCGQKLVSLVNTSEFNIKPFLGEREVPFTLVKGYRDRKGNVYKEGVFRHPTGADREAFMPVIKKNVSTALSMLITRCVTFEGNVRPTQDLVSEMAIRDRDIIEKIMKENSFGIDTHIEGLICDNCGTDISGEIGQSNFF